MHSCEFVLEQLAFPILKREERDLPEIWVEPLSIIVEALTRFDTVQQVLHNLPDVELLQFVL